MSCSEWESGKIVIPAKEWARFRIELLKDWNRYQQTLFEDAKRAYPIVKAAVKGKRGHRARAEAVRKSLEHTFREDYERADRVRDLLVDSGWDNEKREPTMKLHAPRKKDLKTVATSKDATIHIEDATIVFTNKTRTLKWTVHENNHARDHAHQHWFAKRLFAALDRIKWARGSGGKIVGNDEYNQENREAGGGANYVTREYGPKVKLPRFNRGYYNY